MNDFILMAMAFTAASGVMIIYALISMTRPNLDSKKRRPFSLFDAL
jgi:hypothetical protein